MSGKVSEFCLFLTHLCKLLTIKGAQFGPHPGARNYKNRGLAKVGPTKIGVWRNSDRRFPYFSEARVDVFPTFLNLGSTISLLSEARIDVFPTFLNLGSTVSIFFRYNSMKFKLELHMASICASLRLLVPLCASLRLLC